MPGKELQKACTKCGESKPLGSFSLHPGCKGGRHTICKACMSANTRAWYAKNREGRLAKLRERQNDPAFVAEKRAYDREHYLANRERKMAHQRAYYRELAKDPARIAKKRECDRKWTQAHPEAKRARVRKRRAQRAEAFVADVHFDDILQRDLGTCGICERQITVPKIDLDHIIPLAAGGTHEPKNVQLAHPLCNQRKHAKLNFSLAS